ncbi:MAG TPA: TetR/AcrR family transcriptional regulator [Actinomycetaceae bacterium]|nr:TetR/AcrR family transcriptional regulator [Actinomycetaceae bacterium]
MPRIIAPTVAEHRAARERALLDAAHAILLETGEAPGLAAVAERVGLARTSVYQYFRSRRELLQAMVRDVYPRWVERVAAAMGAAPTTADQVLAYAAANVELVAEGAHAVGSALAALDPGEALDAQAMQMHRELQEPLVAALESLDVESPEEVAGLVNAVVHAATVLLESGRSPAEVLDRMVVVLGPMVRELGGRGVLPPLAK